VRQGAPCDGDAPRKPPTRRHRRARDGHDDSWDLRGPVPDTTTVYRLVEAIANSDDWPSWDADSEFAADRAKTKALRKAR
jgi:hypothetical protein